MTFRKVTGIFSVDLKLWLSDVDEPSLAHNEHMYTYGAECVQVPLCQFLPT